MLVREAGGTLVTIAKDVKIQVEFNPQAVSAYRLIGYENRLLNKRGLQRRPEGCRRDRLRATRSRRSTRSFPVGVDDAEPGRRSAEVSAAAARAGTCAVRGRVADELMTVKLRYKAPDGDTEPARQRGGAQSPAADDGNIGFASAVAEFGMLLRGSQHAATAASTAVAARARKFRGSDADGYRAEFIKLAELAASLRVLDSTSVRVR